jgi:hypothetical protein
VDRPGTGEGLEIIMNGNEQFAALERAVKTMDNVHIINKKAGSITIQLKNDKGIGSVRIYALFPGIFLGFNDVETRSFPRFKGEIIHGFKINFCVDGRCEVKLSNDKYLFLEKGDISFSNLAASDDFSLPYDRYHGIELHIYELALKQNRSSPLDIFGIDLMHICKKYCPASGNFVFKAGEEIKSVLALHKI